MTQPAFEIRPARFTDASDIFALIRRHPDELVTRSKNDILQNIDRFFVAVAKGKLCGVVAFGILPEIGSKNPSIELKSLAVDGDQRGTGLGRALVERCLERIRELGPDQVIVLTFVADFFRKFGFREIAKSQIMHKLYSGCLNCTRFDNPFTCPEIAMSLPLAPPAAG